MDTRRIILFVIFSFSALFLWQAWQQEHAPPPVAPKVDAAAPAPADARPRRTCRCRRPLPPRRRTAAPPASVPTPTGAPLAPAGQKVTIKTDLYTAEIDTAGGVISLVSLNKHQRRDRPDASRTTRCSARPSARSSRRRG